jgi:hypothetical protein
VTSLLANWLNSRLRSAVLAEQRVTEAVVVAAVGEPNPKA